MIKLRLIQLLITFCIDVWKGKCDAKFIRMSKIPKEITCVKVKIK